MGVLDVAAAGEPEVGVDMVVPEEMAGREPHRLRDRREAVGGLPQQLPPGRTQGRIGG